MIVVAHDPAWAAQFAAEAEQIAAALAPHLLALHHIGSTSVPGIHAKPIIDMLAVARSLTAVDAATPALVALGYQAMGAFGITGRRYFRKDDAAGQRTHHLHCFARRSPHIARHLAFRDYLRAHPLVAADYGALKLRLAQNPDTYVEGKAPFIVKTQAQALTWYQQRRNH